jgi:hypothetical protein
MRRALQIDEASYGTEHPNVARDLNNLSGLLQATNRMAEAEPMMARAVEIFRAFERATGYQHPHSAGTSANHASLLERLRQPRWRRWFRWLLPRS